MVITLKEMLKDQREHNGEYPLGRCAICCNPTFSTDVIGFSWCEEHEHRGQVLSWGNTHGYPSLPVEGLPLSQYGDDGELVRYYAVGEGEYHWWLLAAYRPEELVWPVVFYTEHLDSLQQAML